MDAETSIQYGLGRKAHTDARLAGVDQLQTESTEGAIAQLFAEKHTTELRYCHTRGKW
jgi:hypothetical protein